MCSQLHRQATDCGDEVVMLTTINAIDACLVLAIVAQTISLTDLFLTPEQKALVSRTVDDLTLRIEYARANRWFSAWTTSRARYLIATCSSYVVIGAFYIYFYATPLFRPDVDQPKVILSFLFSAAAIAI